jgi:hypothetical protein
MTERAVKPVLLFIAGSNRSGSTLLDLLIAHAPGVVSGGELRRFDEYVERNKKCTCGIPFDKCPFWNQVAATFPATYDRESAARRYWQRVDGIATVAGAGIVIDSSKSPDQLELILSEAGHEVRVIHLVRDGRAVAYSESTRGANYARAVLRWAWINSRIVRMLKSAPAARSVEMRYEDLCAHPAETLRRALESIGITYHPMMAVLDKVGRHNIGGSQHRFNPEDTKITTDEKWRARSTRWMAAQFAVLGAWLNSRFGYSR